MLVICYGLVAWGRETERERMVDRIEKENGRREKGRCG